jgi:tetratricopeptide (TPR) repeat protein
VKLKTAQSSKLKGTPGERQFYAEAQYADSIFRDARGDREGSIVALKRALEAMPTHAPAILSMGSVLYQSGRIAEGRELFQSLLSLPKHTADIRQIIDEAGTFLTRFGAYQDGMALYRTAVKRYPDDPALFQGSATAPAMQVCTRKRCPRTGGHWNSSRRIRSWSTTSAGLSYRPAVSGRLGKPWSGRSRWIRAMSWRKRICVIAGSRSHGRSLTKRGTLNRLAVLLAHSAEKRTPSLPFTTNTVGRWSRHRDTNVGIQQWSPPAVPKTVKRPILPELAKAEPLPPMLASKCNEARATDSPPVSYIEFQDSCDADYSVRI